MFRQATFQSPDDQLKTTVNLTRLRHAYLEDCERMGELHAKTQLFLRIHCAVPTSLHACSNNNVGYYTTAATGLPNIIGDPISEVEITGSKEIGLTDSSGQFGLTTIGSANNIELLNSNSVIAHHLRGIAESNDLGLGATDLED
jgi:hypothetical protein